MHCFFAPLQTPFWLSASGAVAIVNAIAQDLHRSDHRSRCPAAITGRFFKLIAKPSSVQVSFKFGSTQPLAAPPLPPAQTNRAPTQIPTWREVECTNQVLIHKAITVVVDTIANFDACITA